MLADQADQVIGVDTHTSAVVECSTGMVGPHTTTSADSLGYKRLHA